jgi:hypothetical protein
MATIAPPMTFMTASADFSLDSSAAPLADPFLDLCFLLD